MAKPTIHKDVARKIKKEERKSLQEVADFFGYGIATMYRYVLRPEFKDYVVISRPRSKVEIGFSEEFKNKMYKLLSGLKERKRWQKPKEVKEMSLGHGYVITSIEIGKVLDIVLRRDGKEIQRFSQNLE